jgi:uncharacterized protein YqeY
MLFERINRDYVTAMKARDSIKAATLSFLRAQLKNGTIEKRVDRLEDPDVLTVIKKQVKQRQDSITQYRGADRHDLADKEAAELAVLQAYLPDEMPADELAVLVREVIYQTGAGSMKDMGAVMKAVIDRVQGRADNRAVSEAVKLELGKL